VQDIYARVQRIATAVSEIFESGSAMQSTIAENLQGVVTQFRLS
jgi:hypothetical protein